MYLYKPRCFFDELAIIAYKKKQKYYVVWKGHHPGIYESWA
ncbi:MAG: hypothetical protein GQ527_00905, partial [Bacteroidales bacterium]|nr:hypothetical protein [Bacteroidales bacterium]